MNDTIIHYIVDTYITEKLLDPRTFINENNHAKVTETPLLYRIT
jgi:hypothetical protein